MSASVAERSEDFSPHRFCIKDVKRTEVRVPIEMCSLVFIALVYVCCLFSFVRIASILAVAQTAATRQHSTREVSAPLFTGEMCWLGGAEVRNLRSTTGSRN